MQTFNGTEYTPNTSTPFYHTSYYCCETTVPTYHFQPNTCCSQQQCLDTLVSQHKPCFSFLLTPHTPRFTPQFRTYLSALASNNNYTLYSNGRVKHCFYSFGDRTTFTGLDVLNL